MKSYLWYHLGKIGYISVGELEFIIVLDWVSLSV